MNVGEIIAAFVLPKQLPEAAITAARAQREQLIPDFLAEIDKLLASDIPEADSIDSPLFFILPLLGEWQVAAAYRPVCRLLAHLDEECAGVLFGDGIGMAGQVVLRTFDGDLQPIFDVIESISADPMIRSQMFDVLVRLVFDGRIERETVEAYVRDISTKLIRSENMVWEGWQSAVSLLALDDMAELARQAIRETWVPDMMMTLRHFDETLAYARAHPEKPWRREYSLVAAELDALEYCKRFTYGLNNEEDDLDLDSLDLDAFNTDFEESADLDWHPSAGETAVNLFRDVGRNDPCPCGSGKKFKKCCIDKLDVSQTR